jgi:hypothetical protein
MAHGGGEKVARPFSQIETPTVREPPPASKTELAWEAGLRQWRKLKRLRAQFLTEGGSGGFADINETTGIKRSKMATTVVASPTTQTSSSTMTKDGVVVRPAENVGVTATQNAPAAKVNYKAKLDKYQQMLKVNQSHRKLMEELRAIEDQTVARTIEDDSDDADGN